MYYVFFETRNEDFFSRIADAFCTVVVKSIINILYEIKSTNSVSFIANSDFIDKKLKMRELFKSLSCTLFPVICCNNKDCKESNIAVLTSTQLNRFEISMTNISTKLFVENSIFFNPNERLNFQRILQNYISVNVKGIDQINIVNNNNHSEYMRMYINETNKLKGKADGYVYVRGKIKSDYDYFKTHTKLSNVIACDYFQII